MITHNDFYNQQYFNEAVEFVHKKNFEIVELANVVFMAPIANNLSGIDNRHNEWRHKIEAVGVNEFDKADFKIPDRLL